MRVFYTHENAESVKVIFGSGGLLVHAGTNRIRLSELAAPAQIGKKFHVGSLPETRTPFNIELCFLNLEGLKVLLDAVEGCKGRMENQNRRKRAELQYALESVSK